MRWQVGLLSDLALDADPQLGFGREPRRRALVLDQAERVRDVRPAARELGRSRQATSPESQ